MRVLLAVLVMVAATGGNLSSQAITSLATTKAVPAPTLAQYDAIVPNNVSGSTGDAGGTGNIILTHSCGGNANLANACPLRFAAIGAGTPLALEWRLVSAGTGGTCIVGENSTGIFQDVVVGQVIQRTRGNGSGTCTGVTIEFRVKGLSYTAHQSTGTALFQGVTLSSCKPPTGCPVTP